MSNELPGKFLVASRREWLFENSKDPPVRCREWYANNDVMKKTTTFYTWVMVPEDTVAMQYGVTFYPDGDVLWHQSRTNMESSASVDPSEIPTHIREKIFNAMPD